MDEHLGPGWDELRAHCLRHGLSGSTTLLVQWAYYGGARAMLDALKYDEGDDDKVAEEVEAELEVFRARLKRLTYAARSA